MITSDYKVSVFEGVFCLTVKNETTSHKHLTDLWTLGVCLSLLVLLLCCGDLCVYFLCVCAWVGCSSRETRSVSRRRETVTRRTRIYTMVWSRAHHDRGLCRLFLGKFYAKEKVLNIFIDWRLFYSLDPLKRFLGNCVIFSAKVRLNVCKTRGCTRRFIYLLKKKIYRLIVISCRAGAANFDAM